MALSIVQVLKSSDETSPYMKLAFLRDRIESLAEIHTG